VIARFETNPEALPEYERAVKLDESVLRFLVVANEGPMQEESAPAEAPAEEAVTVAAAEAGKSEGSSE
jgi:ribosomal protein S6